MNRCETRPWLVRGAIATALLVPLLLWLSGCWLFNVAPVAAFTVRATIVNAGESLAFSAILSSDEDGIIAKFEWDFGDGGSATGESVTHTFAAVGQYTVVLRVTDDRGATATAQKLITVNPAEENGGGTGGGAVLASFTATPLTGESPLPVTFNASASVSPEAAITAYFWDFGDGTNGTGITTNHTYGPTVTTSYNVVLRVIDSNNDEDTATKTITVTVPGAAPVENAPTASFTTAPGKVTAPQHITADGGNSAATTGRTLTEWIWRFGDGTSPQSLNDDDPIRHNYETDQASETFTITLIVVDNENGTDTEQRNVVVENKQPVAGFEIDDDVGGGGNWIADDVDFPDATDADIQTDSAVIWIRSEEPTGNEGSTPTPNDGTEPEPEPKTAAPGNYGDGDPGGNKDNDLCYDPEGQGWDNGTPFGWPNAAWGIEWYKVNWDDGNTQFIGYTDGVGLLVAHQYTNLVVGWNEFDIAVTAIDFLGAETTFSRRIRIYRSS